MKYIISFLLFFVASQSFAQCDTVGTVGAFSTTYNSTQISFTTPNAHINYVIVYIDGTDTSRQNVNDPGSPYPHLVTAPLTGLTPSTMYTYYIVANCAGPDSALTSNYTFTTTAPSCDTVTNINVSVTNNSATISADEAAYGDTYTIFYIRSGQVDTVTVSGGTADHVLSGLKNNTVYYYRIRTNCTTYSDTTSTSVHSFTTASSPNYTPMDNKGYQYKRTASDSTQNIPTGPTPDLRGGKNDKAALFFDSVSHILNVFDPVTQDWVPQTASPQSLQSVTDIDSVTTHAVKAEYVKTSNNTIDTQNIRNNTTINFIGETPTVQLPNFVDGLKYLTGKTFYNGGVSGETSEQIAARMLEATDKFTYGVIIEAGRNNYTPLAQVISDIAKMVAALGHTNYMVLSVFNGSGEGTGTAAYDSIIALNDTLAAIYGSNFIDARTYLVSQYNPGIAQDVTDHANDVPPTSLRQDFLHPNKFGAWLIAQYIYSNFSVMGSKTSIAVWGDSFTSGSFPLTLYGYQTVMNNPPKLTSTQVATTLAAKSYEFGDLSVINTGRYNWHDSAQVIADIARIVDSLDTDKYLVFSVLNGDTLNERSGHGGYDTIIALNNRLSAIYGSHYFDSRAYLVSQYNPGNATDVTNHTNDVPPSTLRIDWESPNTAGNTLLRTQIINRLETMKGTDHTALTTANLNDAMSVPGIIGGLRPNVGRFSKLFVNTANNTDYQYAVNIGGGHVAIDGTLALVMPSQDSFPGSLFVGNGGYGLSTGNDGQGGRLVTGVGIYSLFSNTTGILNTGLGYQSLKANTTGNNGVAIGATALYSNTTGNDNVGIGARSLYANTTGISNVGVGTQTLYANTIGVSNTAIGYRSQFRDTTASYNTSVGAASMLENLSGLANTAIGSAALQYNTSGSKNTALGYNALYASTTSDENTAIGAAAMQNNTSGPSNTALGYSALFTNSTGTGNTALGWRAMNYNQTSSYNTAVGYQSLYSDTVGGNNTAVGYWSLKNNYGTDNVGIGYIALGSNTDGINNTGVGEGALFKNTTASNNTALGFDAGYNNLTGTELTALGYRALFNTTATGNTGVGFEAGFTNAGGTNNTAIGRRSMYTNASGSNNTALGYQSLYSTTTGGNNTAIGYRANFFATTAAGNTALGYLALTNDTTGGNNVAIGYQAGFNDTTGGNNVFLGYNTGVGISSGSYNTIIGSNQSGFTGSSANIISLTDGQSNAAIYGSGTAGTFAIGSKTTDASAVLNLPSTTKGFLPPSMTTTQKNAISSPTAGLTVYDNVLNQLYTYNGSSWLAGGGGGTTTNTVTFNNGGAGDASGTTFNGGTARTISYNTLAAAGTAAANIYTGSNSFRGGLNTAGSISATAWGTNGANFNINASTITDNSTSASATVGSNFVNTINVPTLAATNASITYTNAATLYIAGPPTAGTNVTLTNPYALQIQSGNVRLSTVTSGTWNGTAIGLAYGGTASNLSATGGAGKFLKQASSGAAITVVQPSVADLSDGSTGSGTVVLNTAPTLTGNTTITNGNLTLGTAGNKLVITEGTDGRVGQTTLVSGTKAITITGLTTSSRAIVTLVTPSGTTLTVLYQAVCTANTLTIQANVAAGTINTADGSTLNYFVLN
jgi:hypothetical protein